MSRRGRNSAPKRRAVTQRPVIPPVTGLTGPRDWSPAVPARAGDMGARRRNGKLSAARLRPGDTIIDELGDHPRIERRQAVPLSLYGRLMRYDAANTARAGLLPAPPGALTTRRSPAQLRRARHKAGPELAKARALIAGGQLYRLDRDQRDVLAAEVAAEQRRADREADDMADMAAWLRAEVAPWQARAAADALRQSGADASAPASDLA